MNSDDFEDRFLKEGPLAAICDHWDLNGFLDDSNGRRAEYFNFIDEQIAIFQRRGQRIDDGALRDIVFIFLRRDRSYRLFLKEKGARQQILDADHWTELLHAGAGAILCNYAEQRKI